MREAKVMVRVSEDEHKLLERMARERGLPVASWSRMELLRLAREGGNGAVNEPEQENGPQLLSLFCGPGGLDEGFRQAGFGTAIAMDTFPAAVETFRYNHPRTRCEVRDIRTTTLEHLDELYGSQFQPRGVLGGPPCQSFSHSNVYQTDDDHRHQLPEAYAALLAQLNRRHPISFFVFENVPGLLGKKHIHRYQQFKRLFAEAGFKIAEKELNAKDYGVPQDRPRIFIVGINEVLHPNAEWVPPEPVKGEVTVRQVIAGLPDPVHNAPALDPETFPVHPNHWCFVPRSEKFRDGRLQEGEMWGRSFRTLTWDEVSWTVAYGHREVHVHPTGRRRVSIYEAMLLQSFPERYRLLGTITDQCALVSDAVPPKLARFIAHSVRASLNI